MSSPKPGCRPSAAIHTPDASRSERLLLLLDHLGVAPEAVQATWRGEAGGEEVEITRHGKTVACFTQAAAPLSSGPGRSCADLEDSVIDAQAVATANAQSLPLATHDHAIQASGVIPIWPGTA